MKKKFIYLLVTLFIFGCANVEKKIPLVKTEVSIVLISPSEGEIANGNSVITAKVDYTISDSEWELGSEIKLALLFDTTRGNVTFDGSYPAKYYPKIVSQIGQVPYSYPLSFIWQDKRLKKPASAEFYLLKSLGGGKSIVIAKSRKVNFK